MTRAGIQVPPGPSPWQALPAFIFNRPGFAMGVAQHGELVSLPLGPLRGYLVTHPALVQEVLQEKSRAFPKSGGKGALARFLGDGLAIATGQTWLQQRRLMQPAFHRSAIERLVTTIADVVGATLDSAPLQGRLELRSLFRRLTMEVAARVFFGSTVRGGAAAIDQAVTTALRYLSLRTALPGGWPAPGRRRFERAAADLDSIIYSMIAARREAAPAQPDVLDLLIHARDEESGAQLSDRQVRDQVLSVFLAGFETTANLLTWTWILLLQHPQAHDRLYNEVERVCGAQQPGSAELRQLTYTRMVIDETLRLYPPLWMFWRATARPETLAGFPLEQGQRVYLSPFVTHRLPAFWPDPHRFQPERFDPSQAPQRPKFAYFPFGGGPRQCIGNVLAPLEAQIIIAMLAQRAVFSLEGPPPPAALSLTLHPARAVWARCMPRATRRAS
jgi:cytochrome P450